MSCSLPAMSTGLGAGKEAVLHTAQSLLHDHVAARAHGPANAWIDRQRLSTGGETGATMPVADDPRFDFQFFTLQEMADAAGAAGGIPGSREDASFLVEYIP